MKIVHIIIGLNIGGAELMLKRLIESSGDKKNISVISLTGLGALGKDFQKLGVKVYPLEFTNVFSLLPLFFSIRNLLKIIKPEVVQTWMYHSDFIGGLAAKSVGIKDIYWNVRNTNLSGRGFINLLFRMLCAFSSHIIPLKIVFVSHSALNSHVSVGYSKSKSVVITNGFDLEKFSFRDCDRVSIRRQLDVSNSHFLVCSIGRYATAKDHKTFIKSIKSSVVENPNIRAVMVGKDVDNNNKEITSEISGYEEYFYLLGSRSDIAFILSGMDAFCLHSITEGFPNVLGEAMAVGLPCVTTRAGDAEMMLGDENFTSEIGDYSRIAHIILYLSRLPLDELIALGLKNRKIIEENNSIEIIFSQYESLYSRI